MVSLGTWLKVRTVRFKWASTGKTVSGTILIHQDFLSCLQGCRNCRTYAGINNMEACFDAKWPMKKKPAPWALRSVVLSAWPANCCDRNWFYCPATWWQGAATLLNLSSCLYEEGIELVTTFILLFSLLRECWSRKPTPIFQPGSGISSCGYELRASLSRRMNSY